MSWTRLKLQALENAMQAGVLSVSQGGKSVTYASFEDLRKAYEYGLSQVLAAESGSTAPRSRMVRMTQTGTGLQ